MITAREKMAAIQRIMGIDDDGIPGAVTNAAWATLSREARTTGSGGISGFASSFADPADVAAFRRCKATGKTDKQCFAVGDNGIGLWGDDTTVDKHYCALPRDDWQHLGLSAARGKKVAVTIAGKTVICELRDTMPWKKNVKNGAVVDLNPGAAKHFGLKPPFKVPASWKWA